MDQTSSAGDATVNKAPVQSTRQSESQKETRTQRQNSFSKQNRPSHDPRVDPAANKPKIALSQQIFTKPTGPPKAVTQAAQGAAATSAFPQPRITLKLSDCKYEIFRRIGVGDLNFRAIMAGDIIQTRQTLLQLAEEKEARKAMKDATDEESDNKMSEDSDPEVGPDEAPIESPKGATRPDGNKNPKFAQSMQTGPGQKAGFDRRRQIQGAQNKTSAALIQSSFMRPIRAIANQQNPQNGEDGEPEETEPLPPPIPWDICWQDFGIQPHFLETLKPHQRVNHFLGMQHIARKNTLGINLKRFQKAFPDDYNFFPRTWIYPSDFHDIQAYCQKKTEKRKELIESGFMTEEESKDDPEVMLICKPEAGCQGKGIFIARSCDQMRIQIDDYFQKKAKEYEEYLKAEASYDVALQYSHTQSKAQQQAVRQQEKETYAVNQMAGISNAKEEEAKQKVINGQLQLDENGQVIPPEFISKHNNFVVQKYLKTPALWKGHKFDFRIYVLVTSVIDPMTVFLYQDGLVRLASHKYTTVKDPKNPDQEQFVHLTNYSLNKKNEDYDGDLHKLKLSDMLKGRLSQSSQKKGKPGTSRASGDIWREIEDIVIKTILTVQPQLQHIYRSCQTKEPDTCFELLGFDIMLDQQLKPWMIEVNHTPSFQCDTGVDAEIKNALIKNTLEIIQLSVEQRKKTAWDMKMEQRENMKMNNHARLSVKEHTERVRFDPTLVEKKIENNNFKLIYPKGPDGTGDNQDVYDKILKKATTMWKEATGTNTKIVPVVKEDKVIKKVKKKKKKPAAKEKDLTDYASDDKEEEEEKDEKGVYNDNLSQSWNPRRAGKEGSVSETLGSGNQLTRNASSALRSKPSKGNDLGPGANENASLQFNFPQGQDKNKRTLLQQTASKRHLSAAANQSSNELQSGAQPQPAQIGPDGEPIKRPIYIPMQHTKSSQAKSKVAQEQKRAEVERKAQENPRSMPMGAPPANTPQLTSIAKLTLSLMGSMPPSAFSGLYEQLNGCKPTTMTQQQWQDLLKAASENLMARGSPLVSSGVGPPNGTPGQTQYQQRNADIQSTMNNVLGGHQQPNLRPQERYRDQYRAALSGDQKQADPKATNGGNGYQTQIEYAQRNNQSTSQNQIPHQINPGNQAQAQNFNFTGVPQSLQDQQQQLPPGMTLQNLMQGSPNTGLNAAPQQNLLNQQQQPSLQFLSYLYQQFHKKSGDNYLIDKMHQSNQTQQPENVGGAAPDSQNYERDLNQWFITRIKSILASELLNAAQQSREGSSHHAGPFTGSQAQPLLARRGDMQQQVLQPGIQQIGAPYSNRPAPPNVILNNIGVQPQPSPATFKPTNAEGMNELAAKGMCVWGNSGPANPTGVTGHIRRGPNKQQKGAMAGFTPMKTEIATVDMSAGFEQAAAAQTNHKRLYYVNVQQPNGQMAPQIIGNMPMPIASQFTVQNFDGSSPLPPPGKPAFTANGFDSSFQSQNGQQPQFSQIPVNGQNQGSGNAYSIQPPGSKGSQQRQALQGNFAPAPGVLISPKQTQLQQSMGIRKQPRELNQIMKGLGASGGKTIIQQQERVRQLNVVPDGQKVQKNDANAKQQQQWMRKASNMPPGQNLNTMQSNTIEDVIANNNFNSSHGRGSGIGAEVKNVGNYNNYEAIGGPGQPQKTNSVHLPQNKKPFSLAGALLNDYNRQPMMYQNQHMQPQSAAQTVKPVSGQHMATNSFGNQANTGFNFERNSVANQSQSGQNLEHIQQHQAYQVHQNPPRALQTIQKIHQNLHEGELPPGMENANIQKRQQFYHEGQSNSALQRGSQAQGQAPRQDSQRFSAVTGPNQQMTADLPHPNGVQSASRRHAEEDNRADGRYTVSQPVQQNVAPQSTGSQPPSFSALGNSVPANAMAAVGSGSYPRQSKKAATLGINPNGGNQQRLGDVQGGVLTSGMHSLEKLKEYESRLLLQNSQTHLTMPTNSTSGGSKARKSEHRGHLGKVDVTERPMSNRQLRNMLGGTGQKMGPSAIHNSDKKGSQLKDH